MCLAVPGKVVEITGEGELRMGKVDFSGVQRQACLAYVPEVQLGDYVLVHVGFAISRIDEQAAHGDAGRARRDRRAGRAGHAGRGPPPPDGRGES